MKRYNLINNILGWVCFAIAATTYLLTIEPTASFWDCPEFISQGYKLEVGHPPGNPIFMLTARFFINFVGSEPGSVAMAVNSMNALLSAATIMLLFWTVTYLTRRLISRRDEVLSEAKTVICMGAGLVGALAYAWSDTFWYSAVEGEVYAFSSFCTAIVFWLILKWDARADLPHSDRYLILIAYIIGVSIAVHLLNLLCIPAIVLVFYYRKWNHTSTKGSIAALLVSFVIVALILFGLVPGFVEVAQYVELFFVNTLGLGYNSGVIFYTFAALAIFIWTIYELYHQRSAARIKASFALSVLVSGIPFIGSSLLIPVIVMAALLFWLAWVKKLPIRALNLVALSIFVIFIGYSSYALLLIRSSAETPINQNAPDNVFSLASYLNREQYGETPLLYGTTFTSEVQRDAAGNAISSEETGYAKTVKSSPDEKDRYVPIVTKTDYTYIPEQNMLFPRIYSAQFASQYMNWIGMSPADMETVMATATADSPVKSMKRRPTFAQNLAYFFNYQLNHMYLRYFMWNFAGRQNDLQGNGEINRGNWISGIPFIDSPRLGDQSLLPAEYGAGNKGHNVYFMLPLILGIIGLLWQSLKGEKGIRQFWVIFFLFFMTGVAIVLYLNQTPNQPRERDYAFAGSFYAFAIWIGLGVAAIADGINTLLKEKQPMVAAIVASILGLCVPLQMVSQTWDDHDRSGRFTARDFGMNYLSSLEPNAIIFTNGDNDTFPLWYAQEVEGFRTDVRVVNLSYLTTDWYAAQQKLPAYDALPVNMLATNQDLGLNRRQSGFIDTDGRYLGEIPFEGPVLDFLKEYYGPGPDSYGVSYPIISAKTLIIPGDSLKGEDDIVFDLQDILEKKNHQSIMTQSDALTLDILATSAARGWDRPVYIANTVADDYYLGLHPWMYNTGMARKIEPHYSSAAYKALNDSAYENVMNRFRWGGLDAEGGQEVYLDETVQRMVASTRYSLMEIVRSLYLEGKDQMALDVLNLMTEKLPSRITPYGVQEGDAIATMYVELGRQLQNPEAVEKGLEIYRQEIIRLAPYLPWLASLTPAQFASVGLADRAVYHITDSEGDYSYILSLLSQYQEVAGKEATAKLIEEVMQTTGVNLYQFLG